MRMQKIAVFVGRNRNFEESSDSSNLFTMLLMATHYLHLLSNLISKVSIGQNCNYDNYTKNISLCCKLHNNYFRAE